MKFKIVTRIVAGKPPVYDWAEFLRLMRLFNGKEVVLHVEENKVKKSAAQLGYYWSVMVPHMQKLLREVAGTYATTKEVHAMLTARFLTIQAVSPDGEPIDIPKGVSGLTQEEMSVYIDHVREWVMDVFNSEFPEPHPKPDKL